MTFSFSSRNFLFHLISCTGGSVVVEAAVISSAFRLFDSVVEDVVMVGKGVSFSVIAGRSDYVAGKDQSTHL
jgi:hypothetical protein